MSAAATGCERHPGDPHNLCPACWAAEPAKGTQDTKEAAETLRDFIGHGACDDATPCRCPYPSDAAAALAVLVAQAEASDMKADAATASRERWVERGREAEKCASELEAVLRDTREDVTHLDCWLSDSPDEETRAAMKVTRRLLDRLNALAEGREGTKP